eukprot:TRINITY_DN2801_c0_g1_i3.p1 TRINITY_DN2801_c0_g1~~TRINITY_DN2801_c0_g1_i3.p1  ORF type:complete len:210 (+),score=-8.55 TRINITY_DN2801_c0_g1_i3:890-1519(+)
MQYEKLIQFRFYLFYSKQPTLPFLRGFTQNMVRWCHFRLASIEKISTQVGSKIQKINQGRKKYRGECVRTQEHGEGQEQMQMYDIFILDPSKLTIMKQYGLFALVIRWFVSYNTVGFIGQETDVEQQYKQQCTNVQTLKIFFTFFNFYLGNRLLSSINNFITNEIFLKYYLYQYKGDNVYEYAYRQIDVKQTWYQINYAYVQCIYTSNK